MKIFFLAHISSDRAVEADYDTIINILTQLGHEVIYKHVFDTPEDLAKLSESELEARAKNLSSVMLECDSLVYEGTISSTGAGFLLSKALANSVPTLFLIQRKYVGLYLADPNRLLTIKRYDPLNIAKLKSMISSFLKFATNKRLTRRFNLMISDSLYDYLDSQAKSNNISMSDFVRNMLYEKMDGKKI